ncbi:MAG: hypothetical protein ACYDDE_00700 [bacterium]
MMSINEKIKWFNEHLEKEKFNHILSICKSFVKDTGVKTVDVKTSEDYNNILVLKELGYQAVRVDNFDWKGKKKYIFIYGK